MLTIGMTHTTVDIENLKRVKQEALKRDMTLKEFVNRAIREYLKKLYRKAR